MNLFKKLWARGMRRARDEYEDTQNDIECARPAYRWVIVALLVYCACVVCTGIYWSLEPPMITSASASQRELTLYKIPKSASSEKAQLPSGVTTASTLIAISESLLDKSGGYLANDVFPPGLLLDNMPHWEIGVLTQVRDTTQILRRSLSQSTLNDELDVDLQKAEVRFNFSDTSWGFPSSESQYRSGIEHLRRYNMRLAQSGSAKFQVDAQHLNDYLASIEQGLKNTSQRMTASIGLTQPAQGSGPATKKIVGALRTKTPWLQLDDRFYEARGASWALIAMLKAVEIDFANVLATKNAAACFNQIILELKPTQQTILSPVILNGEGFGLVANHSLTMASYLSRAQIATADCRRQLLASSP